MKRKNPPPPSPEKHDLAEDFPDLETESIEQNSVTKMTKLRMMNHFRFT
jgi:hypothetical protein